MSSWFKPFAPDVENALRDPGGRLDLHTAASVGDIDHLIDLDVESPGLDLAARNQGGWTPLMYAAYYDHADAANFLLDRGGGEVSDRSAAGGRTPLMTAAMCGNEATSRLLMRRLGRAALEERDDRGQTPLFHAVVFGHAALATLLLEAGACVNVSDSVRGFSPLMRACEEGHEVVAQWLIKYGADPAYANILGENARMVAVRNGHEKMLRLLGGGSGRLPISLGISVLDGPAKLAAKLKKEQEQQLQKNLPKDLNAFLEAAGVQKYAELFVGNDLDLEKVLDMDDAALKEAGITLLGPRRKLTSAIARYKAAATSVLTTSPSTSSS